MPADFLDTSVLAKHYHTEIGSAEIDRLWNDPAHGLFVSRLSVLEMASVFAGKVRAGVISVADFDVLRRRFSADSDQSEAPHPRPRLWSLITKTPNGCCASTVQYAACGHWMPCS